MVVELATPQPDLLLHYLVMIRNKLVIKIFFYFS